MPCIVVASIRTRKGWMVLAALDQYLYQWNCVWFHVFRGSWCLFRNENLKLKSTNMFIMLVYNLPKFDAWVCWSFWLFKLTSFTLDLSLPSCIKKVYVFLKMSVTFSEWLEFTRSFLWQYCWCSGLCWLAEFFHTETFITAGEYLEIGACLFVVYLLYLRHIYAISYASVH